MNNQATCIADGAWNAIMSHHHHHHRHTHLDAHCTAPRKPPPTAWNTTQCRRERCTHVAAGTAVRAAHWLCAALGADGRTVHRANTTVTTIETNTTTWKCTSNDGSAAARSLVPISLLPAAAPSCTVWWCQWRRVGRGWHCDSGTWDWTGVRHKKSLMVVTVQ